MRTEFIKTLCNEAENDDRIWLLTGDLGYSVIESFADRFPDRYLNIGVAEQNMIGIASGLAISGKIVFTYSIANFPIMRCLEQIRNDLCYHNVNVNIVAVGGGLEYGAAGYTHHAIEDIAVMRAMPNMTVLAPGDPVETRLATRALVKQKGPCYLRLGKAVEPKIYERTPVFDIGKPIKIKDGKDVTLISTGAILKETIDASESLEKDGVSTCVLSMHTLKPVNSHSLINSLDTKLIVTIEEHSEIGGLADTVGTIMIGLGDKIPKILTINTGRGYKDSIGSQNYLRNIYGLTSAQIKKRVIESLN